MAQDSEKRFHSIMDKLFQPPKSAPSSSSSCSAVEVARGAKRLNPESALALVEPKTIVNTVEKHQHSLSSAGSSQAPLCRPWDRGDLMRRLATFKSMTWFAKPKVVSAVNCARRGWVNVDTDIIACESCGARLLFSAPSSWTQQQVEKAALVFSLKLDNGHKLLCPWIDNICDETLAQFPPTPPPFLVDKFRERSSALLQLLALPVISSSAIEYMRSPQLEEFLKHSLMPECGDGYAKASQIDYLGSACEDFSADLYYQAQKLISLCGWEPRSLPYVVDCEDSVNNFVIDVDGQNPCIDAQSGGSNEIVEAAENSGIHKSVVLDCRLCGASVGLWAFSMVSRPVEFFRVVGYADENGENNSGTHGAENENHEVAMNTVSNGAPLHKDTSPNLNLTIAGGPPPTKQNFKATISLPLIGRTLRAKFSNDSNFSDSIYDKQEEIRHGSKNSNLLKEGLDSTEPNLTGQVVQIEEMGLLRSKQHDQGTDSSTNDEQSPGPNHNASERGDTLGKENRDHMPMEGTSVTQQATFSETANVDPSRGESSGSESRDSSITTQDANLTIANGKQSKNERSLMITSDNAVVSRSTGKDTKQLSEDNAMKFDPIRQHRHFCPWIVSTGSGSPGWQQTLSALCRAKEHFHPSLENSPPSTSVIKVDDPVTSVRNLFMSPVAKRLKPSQ
ncbi:uncharacterized protein LOC116146669 isoform X2 [Pistacia vera]|uniref:uncharacterized protein LOC116146669 isoform X2 n=1 Tax=Pistacia vera TaxID=55513 RepID=UPI001263005C|nr:uncharacterized protein LOC116146669 isoform X2 [Pistacia vera]